MLEVAKRKARSQWPRAFQLLFFIYANCRGSLPKAEYLLVVVLVLVEAVVHIREVLR